MKKPKNQDNPMLSIRVTAEWLKQLDEWIAEQEIKPSRTEVIRVAVLRFIAEKRAK